MREALLRGTHFTGARFARLDATGAQGTLLADDVTIETAAGTTTGSVEELLAHFRASGARGVSRFQPRPRQR